jgi:hypothetical protein
MGKKKKEETQFSFCLLMRLLEENFLTSGVERVSSDQ